MFVPSLQKNVLFCPLTIEQYYKIAHQNFLYPKLNLGFNIEFAKTILTNCTEQINLTSFDKNIIALQIHLNELLEKNIEFSTNNVTHPQHTLIEYNDYIFNLDIPSINLELEISNYIIQNNILDVNILLMCEIMKYINTITFKGTVTTLDKNINEKLKILKQIPPTTLVRCMDYIDKTKDLINNYYSQYTNLKYSISLLIP